MSPEAAILARVAASDLRTMTGANHRLLLLKTGLDARIATPVQVPAELTVMTDEEYYTALDLGQALHDRARLMAVETDTTHIQDIIDNLCKN